MIKTVTMYSVICDRCGKTFIDQFNGIAAWLDEGTAKDYNGWNIPDVEYWLPFVDPKDK